MTMACCAAHAVAPPDQMVWWVVDEAVAAVKRELRLRPSPAPDLDEARWVELVDTAGRMINVHLDRVEPLNGPVPHAWTTALVKLVINLADSGVTLSDDDVTTYAAGDPMATVAPLLRGSKSRFGVA